MESQGLRLPTGIRRPQLPPAPHPLRIAPLPHRLFCLICHERRVRWPTSRFLTTSRHMLPGPTAKHHRNVPTPMSLASTESLRSLPLARWTRRTIASLLLRIGVLRTRRPQMLDMRHHHRRWLVTHRLHLPVSMVHLATSRLPNARPPATCLRRRQSLVPHPLRHHNIDLPLRKGLLRPRHTILRPHTRKLPVPRTALAVLR